MYNKHRIFLKMITKSEDLNLPKHPAQLGNGTKRLTHTSGSKELERQLLHCWSCKLSKYKVFLFLVLANLLADVSAINSSKMIKDYRKPGYLRLQWLITNRKIQ